ncbi:MAG TPA: HDOD domain-containing protein [Candidatus Sumerlaeota bacterium]|nr:HDOD domain-containing protein [Candidatus Sumerlaeota bacterium]HOR28206.1 HDOD domain-containing protein [Candidatus Sumerlaeota bacterium]
MTTMGQQIPQALQELIESSVSLLPETTLEILRLAPDYSTTNLTLQRMLEHDRQHDLADRVLALANSVEFHGLSTIRSIPDAIARIGRLRLFNLVLTSVLGGVYRRTDEYARLLWRHALACGYVCAGLAERFKVAESELAFAAGVLHDIGKFIIYRRLPHLYRQFWIGKSHAFRLIELEARTFPDFAHARVGAAALRRMGLLGVLVEAAALHHAFESGPAKASNPGLVSVVSLGNVLVNNVGLERKVCEWKAIEELYCARHIGAQGRTLDEAIAALPGLVQGLTTSNAVVALAPTRDRSPRGRATSDQHRRLFGLQRSSAFN